MMQTFTLALGSWLRRLFVRNPLVRATDRVEAFVLCAALMLAVLAVPVAGALGTAVYDKRVHEFTAERFVGHELEATATRDSFVTALPYQTSYLTPVQWQFAGQIHTDTMDTPDRLKAGERTSIWVDAAGARTHRPLSSNDAVAEAVLIALALCVAVTGAAAAAGTVVRYHLNRVRYAAWDRELDRLVNNDGAQP